MISILHPSRQRPEKSFNTCKKWLELAGTNDLELIVSIDSDDPTLMEYSMDSDKIAQMKLYSQGKCFSKDNRSAVDAINNAAAASEGNILIVVSDDTDCPQNWAVDLLKAVEGKTDWIAKCSDGIQNWIITMPVMDRAYYNRFGYIYHPEYRHMFCDTELTCVADLTGRKINVDLSFPHLHYSIGGAAKDDVSEKADKTWQQGEDLFLSRIKKNFDLAEVDIVGKITDESYRTWIANKLK